MYAYDNTEHLEGMKMMNWNVGVSPTKNPEIYTKEVTPTATYWTQRWSNPKTSSRYRTPFKTDARGSHEMATAKIGKWKKENAHQKGYTESEYNCFITGRFHRKIRSMDHSQIGRWQKVTESQGQTPERHCRQWHPNSQYSTELFLNIWYRFLKMLPIDSFFSWTKHWIWKWKHYLMVNQQAQ
jgi:hypothetical protein